MSNRPCPARQRCHHTAADTITVELSRPLNPRPSSGGRPSRLSFTRGAFRPAPTPLPASSLPAWST